MHITFSFLLFILPIIINIDAPSNYPTYDVTIKVNWVQPKDFERNQDKIELGLYYFHRGGEKRFKYNDWGDFKETDGDQRKYAKDLPHEGILGTFRLKDNETLFQKVLEEEEQQTSQNGKDISDDDTDHIRFVATLGGRDHFGQIKMSVYNENGYVNVEYAFAGKNGKYAKYHDIDACGYYNNGDELGWEEDNECNSTGSLRIDENGKCRLAFQATGVDYIISLQVIAKRI